MSKLQTATYKVAAFLLVVPERFERPTLRFVVYFTRNKRYN